LAPSHVGLGCWRDLAFIEAAPLAGAGRAAAPHVIEGAAGADPRSPEFLGRFADQVARLARHLDLDEPR
jgi:hypothetical protein